MNSHLLFVNNNIPHPEILINAIQNGVSYYQYDSSTDLSFINELDFSTTKRIGIVFHNTMSTVLFGKTTFQENNKILKFFSNEFFYLLKRPNLIIDLITCNMNNQYFQEEVQYIQNKFNVTINYSLNSTGNIPGADWIMESNGESIKSIYFNDNIDKYQYALGSDAALTVGYIDSNYAVYMFGLNSHFQINFDFSNIFSQTNTSTLVNSFNNSVADGQIIMLSCGPLSTLGLTNAGNVYGWGAQYDLGISTFPQFVFAPTQLFIGLTSGIKKIIASFRKSLVLTNDGKVYFRGVFNSSTTSLPSSIGTHTLMLFQDINNNTNIQVKDLYANAQYLAMIINYNGSDTVATYDGNTNYLLNIVTIQNTNLVPVSLALTFSGVLIRMNDDSLYAIGAPSSLLLTYNELGCTPTDPSLNPTTLFQVPIIGKCKYITSSNYTSYAIINNVAPYNDVLNNVVYGTGKLAIPPPPSDPNGSNTDTTSFTSIDNTDGAVSVSCANATSGNNRGVITLIMKNDGIVYSFSNIDNNSLIAFNGRGTADRNLDALTTPTAYRLFDSQIDFPFCVHGDNLVRTNRGIIPIKNVVKDDYVFDINNQPVCVTFNIRMMSPTNKFIKIPKNSLDNNVPSNDLFMTHGHPVLYHGNEIICENLVGVVKEVEDIICNKYNFVYCISTNERIFIQIENTPVCTWKSSEWLENNGKLQGSLWKPQ